MFKVFITTAVVCFWILNTCLVYLVIRLDLFLVMAAVPVRLCKTTLFPFVVIT